MKTIALTRRPVNAKELRKKTALSSDTDIEYSEPAIFTHEGRPIIFYGLCEIGVEEMRATCRSLNYAHLKRTSGLVTHSRVFGAMPRQPLVKDFVSLSSVAYDQPEQNAALFKFAEYFEDLYRCHAPEIYSQHLEKMRTVLPCWRIGRTVFTSGVVNSSSSLKYHFDGGNFKGALSCMLTLRRHISGGALSIPEFGMRLALQDATYLLFDGQSILHGVTPIEEQSREAYRYTAVYYSLQALTKAKTPDEELADCRRRSTAKLTKRAGL